MPCARIPSCRATRRSARFAFEYDGHRESPGPVPTRRSSMRPRASMPTPMMMPAAPPRRARRARLSTCWPTGEVMLTPSAAGGRARRPPFDRRADVQPTLDVAGHALHQRAGIIGP
jgi:hypothetical protein